MSTEAVEVQTNSRIERIGIRDFDPTSLKRVFADEWSYWLGSDKGLTYYNLIIGNDRWSFCVLIDPPSPFTSSVVLSKQGVTVLSLSDIKSVEINENNRLATFIEKRPLFSRQPRRSYEVSSGGFYHSIDSSNHNLRAFQRLDRPEA